MSDLVYLIGPPGVGKTATMAHLLTGTSEEYRVLQPFAYTGYRLPFGRTFAYLGKIRATGFSGTDALSMNVQPKVLRWLPSSGYSLVIGEGDRLGNVSFLQSVLNEGWTVWLAYLSATAETLEQRRAARGSHQSPTWMAGRLTKVRNLVAWAEAASDSGRSIQVRHIPTSNVGPDAVAHDIRWWINFHTGIEKRLL